MHVEFRQKFPKLIKLKELQKYAKDGGILQKMQTLRQSRLSVSKVSKKEWDFIMSLVEDDDTEKTVLPAAQAHTIADTAAREGIRAERKETYTARSSWSNRAVCNLDVARPLGRRVKSNAENGNAGSGNLDVEMTVSNGNSPLPPAAAPDQKTESGSPEPNASNGETSSAVNPTAKVSIADKSDTEPVSQVQEVTEYLRELAEPLEHPHENVVVDTLATTTSPS